MARKYYALGNYYRSPTSKGFLNTFFVMTFDNVKARAEWLRQDDQAVRACTRREAIDHIVGNETVVGKSMTRREALELIEGHDYPQGF